MPCTQNCRCFTCFVPAPTATASTATASRQPPRTAAPAEIGVSASELREQWMHALDEQRELCDDAKMSFGVEVDRYGTAVLLNTAGGESFRHRPTYHHEARRRAEIEKQAASAAAAAAAARLVCKRLPRAPRVLSAAGTPSVAGMWTAD